MTRYFLIHVPAARMNHRATDMHEAVQQFCDWRDCEGYGASDIGAEFPLYECDASGIGRWRIGTVFYNGRVELRVVKGPTTVAEFNRQNQGRRIAAARRIKAGAP